MITIESGGDQVTVVEVFKVRDGRQAEAVERLKAVNGRIAREPGWIAAAIHRSFDGERIALYAQWRSAEAIRDAMQRPDLRPLLSRLVEVAEPDWHLYEVVSAEAADRGGS